MSRYKLTNKALADLNNIWLYTEKTWSPNQADKYYDMIIEACEALASDKKIFSQRYDKIISGLKGYKIRKHIIVYSTNSDNSIIIYRILHEQMDIYNILKSIDPS